MKRNGEAREDDILILEARTIKADFGAKCSKFAGAVSVEFLRKALRRHGIPVSQRDVFIRGVPIEIDLLIPRPGSAAELDLLWDPANVLVAIEVKNSGMFGADGVARLRNSFAAIKAKCPQITCLYITYEERRNHKWAVTPSKLGDPAFTIA